jgi:hypothetical protein
MGQALKGGATRKRVFGTQHYQHAEKRFSALSFRSPGLPGERNLALEIRGLRDSPSSTAPRNDMRDGVFSILLGAGGWGDYEL